MIRLEPADDSLTPPRIKRSSSAEEIPLPSNRAHTPEDWSPEHEDPGKPTNQTVLQPSNPSTSTAHVQPSDATPKMDESDSLSLANLTCAICLSAPSPAVVTKCGHVTCGECLTASITSQNNSSFGSLPAFLHPAGIQARNQINNGKCPVCRAPLVGGWGTAMRGAILKMGKVS
ncbi:hypothetical protein VP01_1955g6 [Puccinia sorghi]|uniref:RING-type domain-containing protein n=1 Tax=Puccinia sorghi TaxID=27349 RepID=A0A0L6VDW9_9BASI|nr:hypothetical protein VP01_1955g6 [Puccinia sorghi]